MRSQVKLPFVVHFGFGCLADVAVFKEVWEQDRLQEGEEELVEFSHA